MPNYAPLTAIWPNVSGTDDPTKLATLNAMTAAGQARDVSVSAIVGYLGLQGKLKPLINYAATPGTTAIAAAAAVAEALVTLLQSPNAPGFQMSNATVYTTVSGMLATLASDPLSGITATDQTNLLALAAATAPWWQVNGFNGPLNLNDIAAAGLS